MKAPRYMKVELTIRGVMFMREDARAGDTRDRIDQVLDELGVTHREIILAVEDDDE